MRPAYPSLIGLAAVGAMAQSHAIAGQYEYFGCVEIDYSALNVVQIPPPGLLTPESCQMACAGQDFAAVFWDVCRCGNTAPAVARLDETQCDNPCQSNWGLGACGHFNGHDGHYYANLYAKCVIAQLTLRSSVIQPASSIVTLPGPIISPVSLSEPGTGTQTAGPPIEGTSSLPQSANSANAAVSIVTTVTVDNEPATIITALPWPLMYSLSEGFSRHTSPAEDQALAGHITPGVSQTAISGLTMSSTDTSVGASRTSISGPGDHGPFHRPTPSTEPSSPANGGGSSDHSADFGVGSAQPNYARNKHTVTLIVAAMIMII